jgi:hypothetical protein
MRRRRWLARLALALLVLIAELVGRGLAYRIDVGRHVGPMSYRHASYYPVLLACVKVGVALMLARLVWRFFNARRIASLLGGAPRLRLALSWRLWLLSFLGTSGLFLVQTDLERAAYGRWPLLAPWLHSSALPVFAVLAVLVAVVYRTAERWLGDYERFAAVALALCRRVATHRPPLERAADADAAPPRRLFGIAFESRPPPAPAAG